MAWQDKWHGEWRWFSERHQFESFWTKALQKWAEKGWPFYISCNCFFSNKRTGPPPPPPTTLIPHIEVGFKWMWTQLATPNKMAPVFVDFCAGLVVLLPRQICRFRHGFFSSAALDWSLRSCLRVRHLWRQQIADNRRYLRRSFLPWTSSLRSQILLSKRRSGYYGKTLDEAVSNFFFEPSLSEKFGLWKIPIGNHIHLNLTSMCGFSLNPPPLDLSFWSFLIFLHHGIEEVERHLLWKCYKKIRRKSWSNVPPKLLACLYKVVHKIGRLRKFNRSPEIEFNFFTAWTISMKFGTLVQHASGYKTLPQIF